MTSSRSTAPHLVAAGATLVAVLVITRSSTAAGLGQASAVPGSRSRGAARRATPSAGSVRLRLDLQRIALHLCVGMNAARTKSSIAGLFDGRLFSTSLITKIAGHLFELRHRYGRCRTADPQSATQVWLVLKRARILLTLYVKHQAITGFWFRRTMVIDDTLARVAAAFRKLPGRISVMVRPRNRRPLLALAPQTSLAVGSSFKLFVLRALLDAIHKRTASWKEVIPLRKNLMSLPSGILQTWPPQTPVTIASLAALMMSRSDNTATDHLIVRLGRRAVERVAGRRNRPFLTTSEMFKLKSCSPRLKVISARFRRAGQTSRRRLLTELDRSPNQGVGALCPNGHVGQLEWFFTTDELCRTAMMLRGQKLLTINPGLADRGAWRFVGYKGGSEPGVLNMTYVLQNPTTGTWFCVSATWNHPGHRLNKSIFYDLVRRILAIVRRPPIKNRAATGRIRPTKRH